MLVRFALFCAAMLAVGVSSGYASQKIAAPWQLPPAGYVFDPLPACRDNAERMERPSRPGLAHYAVCADQMAILGSGLEAARKARKLLLVEVGATWCAWCAKLQRQLHREGLLDVREDGFDYTAKFHVVELALSTLDRGQKVELASGHAALAALIGRLPEGTLRSLPFLVMIDPDDDARIFARNIDDLAIKGGFDAVRLREVLRNAASHVRDGVPARAEPGWFSRKLQRWWNG